MSMGNYEMIRLWKKGRTGYVEKESLGGRLSFGLYAHLFATPRGGCGIGMKGSGSAA